MPSKSRKSRKTAKKNNRHNKHSGKGKMSIPQLRMGLHHISNISDKLCSSKMSHEQKVRTFQSEWHRVFGKKMDAKVASDYLKHVEKERKGTRKMRGGAALRGGSGAALAGAPVDYMTRPGGELPHGNYPAYVKSGFDVGVPLPGMSASCGLQGGTVPYPGTGSNQVGGGVMDSIGSALGQLGTAAAAIYDRPYTAQNPPTVNMNLGTRWVGQETGPGSQSWQQAWLPRMSPGPNPVIPMAQALQRFLPIDVKQPN